jgi:hypothetical protein
MAAVPLPHHRPHVVNSQDKLARRPRARATLLPIDNGMSSAAHAGHASPRSHRCARRTVMRLKRSAWKRTNFLSRLCTFFLVLSEVDAFTIFALVSTRVRVRAAGQQAGAGGGIGYYERPPTQRLHELQCRVRGARWGGRRKSASGLEDSHCPPQGGGCLHGGYRRVCAVTYIDLTQKLGCLVHDGNWARIRQ